MSTHTWYDPFGKDFNSFDTEMVVSAYVCYFSTMVLYRHIKAWLDRELAGIILHLSEKSSLNLSMAIKLTMFTKTEILSVIMDLLFLSTLFPLSITQEFWELLVQRNFSWLSNSFILLPNFHLNCDGFYVSLINIQLCLIQQLC